MRAVVITKHGPPEVLRVEERPDPQPGPGEVAIDVHAAGVNFADTMARIGLYPDAPKPPCVVGYEVAGTIAALGEGVDGVGGRRPRDGGHRASTATPSAWSPVPRDVIALPERLSYVEGAAIPVNYATAWAALVQYGGLQPGREGADPRRGRRRRHRRHAARQEHRRGGLGHGLAGQARGDPRASASTTRSTTPARAGSATCRSSTS